MNKKYLVLVLIVLVVSAFGLFVKNNQKLSSETHASNLVASVSAGGYRYTTITTTTTNTQTGESSITYYCVVAHKTWFLGSVILDAVYQTGPGYPSCDSSGYSSYGLIDA